MYELGTYAPIRWDIEPLSGALMYRVRIRFLRHYVFWFWGCDLRTQLRGAYQVYYTTINTV